MSGLDGVLANAASGLRATSRWGEVISQNISNANTPGYARKDIKLTTPGNAAGGVEVAGVQREVDQSIDRMFRYAQSQSSYYDATSTALSNYIAKLGTPDQDVSVASVLGKFKDSLINLTNNPSSVSVQRTVVSAAQNLCTSLQTTYNALTDVSNNAQQAANQDIEFINSSLDKLAKLNRTVLINSSQSVDNSTIYDQRDQILDGLSQKMDVRVSIGSDGRASVTTGGGVALLDGNNAIQVSMDSACNVTAGGIDITPNASNPRGFSQGTLAGNIDVVKQVVPQFKGQLDQLANGVITSFSAADTSLAPGQAGLFTDNQTAYNPTNVAGIAQRIAVNNTVVPEQGGQLWRIRDGVGATAANGSDYTTQVDAFINVFSQTQTFSGTVGLPTTAMLTDYASTMVAQQQATKAQADQDKSNYDVTVQTLQGTRSATSGVNIDDELQKMQMVEHSYAANAQMLNAVGKMMDQLLAVVQ
jgi:flagellar hook-associated protein 1 FlgK